MNSKYGCDWVKDLIRDADRHGYKFFNDGAGHLYAHYDFRTGFYDSGFYRELQIDRQQGREKGK